MTNIFDALKQFFGKDNDPNVKSDSQPIDNYPDEYYVDGWGVKHPIRNSSLDDYIDPNEFINSNKGLSSEEIAKLVEELTDGERID